jgi:hypothetical protein
VIQVINLTPPLFRAKKCYIYPFQIFIIVSFESVSPKKLALIFGIAAVAIILALLGSSAKNLLSGSITDEAIVKIKQEGNCIVEGADEIPRMITDCPYNLNDTILITFKEKQPAIEKHEIKQ